ncbi:MAG: hypothetical protein H6722_14260 [Sandaracinus sp.]|nr:hypothetical protein [Sandaracinus sp.]
MQDLALGRERDELAASARDQHTVTRGIRRDAARCRADLVGPEEGAALDVDARDLAHTAKARDDFVSDLGEPEGRAALGKHHLGNDTGHEVEAVVHVDAVALRVGDPERVTHEERVTALHRQRRHAVHLRDRRVRLEHGHVCFERGLGGCAAPEKCCEQ